MATAVFESSFGVSKSVSPQHTARHRGWFSAKEAIFDVKRITDRMGFETEPFFAAMPEVPWFWAKVVAPGGENSEEEEHEKDLASVERRLN